MTNDDDENQEQQHQAVERISQPIDVVIVEADRHEHRDQPKSEPSELPHRQGAGVAGGEIIIGAIDRRDTDSNKGQDEQEERPVEVRNQTPVNLHGFLPAPAHAAFQPPASAIR